MLKTFVAIKKVNDVFQSVYNELNTKFNCSYISYQYSYKNFKLIFATNPEWIDLYSTEELTKNCSLLRVGLQKIASSKTSTVILRWNDVLPISKGEQNTAGIRAEFNICNGISFGRKIYSISDYFGLATDIKNLDFPKKILLNSNVIRSLMDDLFRASTIRMIYDHITSTQAHEQRHNEIIRLCNCLPI